jgi:hypothetical protein
MSFNLVLVLALLIVIDCFLISPRFDYEQEEEHDYEGESQLLSQSSAPIFAPLR